MVGRSVWDRLPDELAERIFAYLPISAVFTCRRVCKQWKSLISSNEFLELWGVISPRHSMFLICDKRHTIVAYSPSSRCWNNIPIYDLCSLDYNQMTPLASSGGLLCFKNRNVDHPNLVVCNPVTGSCRFLPKMPQIQYIDIVGMVSDVKSNSYQILVAGTIEPVSSHSITEVYDSRSGCWTYHCSSKQEFLQFWYEVRAIWHDGFFYCLATPVNTSLGHILIAYDWKRRKWADLNVQMPFGDLRYPSLVVAGGKLLLIAKVLEDYMIKSICIWELEWKSLQWIKISVVPDDILLKIQFAHTTMIQCQGHGDLICFSTLRGWQSFIYNILKQTWEHLPANVDGENQSNGIWRNVLLSLPYEPSLAARV